MGAVRLAISEAYQCCLVLCFHRDCAG